MAEYYEMKTEEVSVAQYDVSVIPNDFNVLTINSLMDSGVISMPSFQRNYVWDRKRASKFIESLIIGLPVPQIFLYIYFFLKQRFPRSGKRAFLRKVFDKNGSIPNNILSDDNYFQDFKLQFARLESGNAHPLSGKKYTTLDITQKGSFELMPIRCMSVRQNKPDDNSAIYEIFSRLNTGGLNLSPQEIRGCLYASDFYDTIYDLNTDSRWRRILGKEEEDDKFRDVEIILRCFALLYNHKKYNGAMIQFLNQFSKEAQKYTTRQIEVCVEIFSKVLNILGEIDPRTFLTKNGSFNVSFFDSVFVAIAEHFLDNLDTKIFVRKENLERLKEDSEFDEAITHSTSHQKAVSIRLKLAKQYLFGSEG